MRGIFLLHLLTDFAVLCAWITVALAVAWAITRFRRRHAAFRHLVQLVALAVILAGPLAAPLLSPHYPVRVPFPSPLQPLAGKAVNRPATDSPPPVTRRHGPAADWYLLSIALAGLWIGGAIVAVTPAFLAPLALRRLYRDSRPGPTDSDLQALTGRAGFRGTWRLRISTQDGLASPMTWGIFRPVVLLPKDAASWPPARCEAVLLHELAHIGRGDSLTGFFAFLVCALYWFHPLVWLTARAMRADAEIAADDQVLATGIKPSFYAAELLRFAARNTGPDRFVAVPGTSGLGSSKIETRISAIIDPDVDRRPLTSGAVAAMQALLLTATTLAIAVRPSVSPRVVPVERLGPMAAQRVKAVLAAFQGGIR